MKNTTQTLQNLCRLAADVSQLLTLRQTEKLAEIEARLLDGSITGYIYGKYSQQLPEARGRDAFLQLPQADLQLLHSRYSLAEDGGLNLLIAALLFAMLQAVDSKLS